MPPHDAIARLQALERWVDEASAVHPRPEVLAAPFERDAARVMALARDAAALQAEVEVRIAALRARLFPGSQRRS